MFDSSSASSSDDSGGSGVEMTPHQPHPMPPIVEDKRVKLVDSIKKAIFVIGTALITFIAARNSITWHCQKVWGASGDLWQSQWIKFYEFVGHDQFVVNVVVAVLLSMIAFWCCNALLLILDVTGWPSQLLIYKIQPNKNSPVDKKKLMRAIKQIVFNQTVMSFPLMVGAHFINQWRGIHHSPELPTFHWVVFEMVIFIAVEEILFYYSHRILHHPSLYRHIHKIHHEWTAPIGLIGLYAHPIEHVIANLIPPLAGPLLMGSHVTTAWLWYCIALISTSISHSGYHFPFLPSPEAHDFHHAQFNQNFGVMGVLDRLHGTDTIFRASKAYQRHFVLFSLSPVSEQYPDTPKK